MTLMSFEEALQSADADEKRPHVLLGNGFSRACRNDIFAYDALFERADFQNLSIHARQAFEALGTTDFEITMRALRSASALVALYEPSHSALTQRLRDDAAGLREVLVEAIAGSHPDFPSTIADEAYAACKAFLANFDRIFTLNYDLLLYWTLMQHEIEPDVPCDDGFRKPDTEDADYVTWEPENTHFQNVYYLHGGLHLFDAGTELQKYTWVNTGVRLIEQIRNALAGNLYPLFVAEGDSDQKLNRIRHNAYLSKAERSLLSLGGTVFIYGHSLAENDQHIFRALSKSKVKRLLISLYGDPTSETNRRVRARAASLVALRPTKKPLEVSFFSAESATVWG
jgi:hypothetical protein